LPLNTQSVLLQKQQWQQQNRMTLVTNKHPMISWRLFSELFIDNINNLTKFILLNARSVNNKLPELYDLLYCMQYNVIIMNESWLLSSTPDGMIDPQGLYTVKRCERESQFATGGVCICF